MGCRGRREGRKEKFRSTKKENNSWKIGNEFIYYCWRQKLQLQESASKCLERTHGMEGRISLLQVGWWGHAYSLLLFCLCLEFLVLFRSRLLLTLPRLFTDSFFCFFFFFLLLLKSSTKEAKDWRDLDWLRFRPIFDFSLIDEEISLDEENCMKISCNLWCIDWKFFAIAIWLSSFSLKSGAQTRFRYLVVNKRSSASVRTTRRSFFTPFIFVSFPVCRFSLYPQSSCPALFSLSLALSLSLSLSLSSPLSTPDRQADKQTVKEFTIFFFLWIQRRLMMSCLVFLMQAGNSLVNLLLPQLITMSRKHSSVYKLVSCRHCYIVFWMPSSNRFLL